MHEKTSAMSYWVSGGVVWLGSLDWNKVSMIGGLLLGIATFAVNWYYKRQNSLAYLKSIHSGVAADEPKE